MQIDKLRKSSWTIKRSPTEAVTFTATDQNGKLLKVDISQSAMSMDYPQFEEFYAHLHEIKQTVETKYYYQSEAKTNDGNAPIAAASQGQKAPSPGPASKQIPSHIVPLVAPAEVKVPEVYILSRAGASLFHFDLKGDVHEQKPDQNLVSGLLGAINLFAENMGWLAGVSLIKSGNIEVRFAKGPYIIVALVSSVEMNLGYLVEPILSDLATELCGQFENFYHDELERGNTTGLIDSKAYDSFKEEFEEFITKYRRQVFEIYQKLILTEAMYLDVPPEICSELIHSASEGRNVVNELADLMKQYPAVKRSIQKVNAAQKPLWDVFSIPAYEA